MELKKKKIKNTVKKAEKSEKSQIFIPVCLINKY